MPDTKINGYIRRLILLVTEKTRANLMQYQSKKRRSKFPGLRVVAEGLKPMYSSIHNESSSFDSKCSTGSDSRFTATLPTRGSRFPQEFRPPTPPFRREPRDVFEWLRREAWSKSRSRINRVYIYIDPVS